jgi:hypothetical protein
MPREYYTLLRDMPVEKLKIEIVLILRKFKVRKVARFIHGNRRDENKQPLDTWEIRWSEE